MGNLIYCKSARMLAITMGEKTVLVPDSRLPADPGQCFCLNDVGAFVWERIDGRCCVSEIASAVCGEFAVQPRQARADVYRFLRQLEEIGAVNSQGPNNDSAGEPIVH